MSDSASITASPAPAWRQFNFFDCSRVDDIHEPSVSPEIFKITPEISTIVSSVLGVLLADIHGSIHLLNHTFEPLKSWVAYVGGRTSHMIAKGNLLITVGEEGASSSSYAPILKVWDLGKKDKRLGTPILLRSVKVRGGGRPHPISTIALSSSMAHFAIGLADGTVLLYRNFEQAVISSGSLTALPKPKVIHESPTEPVTGLGFREGIPEDQSESVAALGTRTVPGNPTTAASTGALTETHLFIVTTNQVLLYHVAGKGSGSAAIVIDEVGCGLGCACMERRGRDIIVAREEAIYLCGIEGRGSCYAYEGPKSSVHTFGHYVVMVSPPFIPSASAASATVRNHVARVPNATASDITKVTVFDIDNKIVAFSGAFAEGIREVFEGWGDLYILGSDGVLSRLEEKPTTEKLEILFQKKLYPLAIGLAESQGSDGATVAGVRRQYGDHLYSKNDFEGAMQQYLRTLGHVQPSYVIRKYLDAQRIQTLTVYLQELHSQGLANSDHTTLLLNAYTKLKDHTKLESFIKTEAQTSREDNQPPFDLDTVIRVCRQAGYFDHAAYLAKRYNRQDDYLRIVIEDKGEYSEALTHFRASDPEEATANLARYGRSMLANLPKETTQLMIDLCTNQSNQGLDGTKVNGLHTGSVEKPPAQVSEADSGTRPDENKLAETNEGDLASQPSLPSPKTFFPHFINYTDHFIHFLEEVISRRWKGPGFGQDLSNPSGAEDKKAVWNTLLELYLTPSVSESGVPSSYQEKALSLIRDDHVPYDRSHALMICYIRSFIPGQILIWEKMGMYEDIIRFWMDRDKESSSSDCSNSREVLRHLDMYGPTHPHLYKVVLRYLTSSSELLQRHRDDVVRVLDFIERENVMAPIEVVQLLSRNNVASVGLVQQWLMKRIKRGKEEVATNRTLIESYRTETSSKLQQVAALSDSSKPRVFHVTRCSACGGPLDLPAIHFMCNHSYHQRCLGADESECPSCAREHGIIAEIRRNNMRLAGQNELFLNEVKEGGFESLAAGFGKGWFEIPPP